MKITNKSLSGRVYINDIEIGGVFFIEDTDSWGEEPFLKLDPNLIGNSDYDEGNYALSLREYLVYEIGYSEPLRKVKSELILT
jgi:hypothetical protein